MKKFDERHNGTKEYKAARRVKNRNARKARKITRKNGR